MSTKEASVSHLILFCSQYLKFINEMVRTYQNGAKIKRAVVMNLNQTWSEFQEEPFRESVCA